MSRLSREKRQQIQDLLAAGQSDSEIAQSLGVDRSTVSRHRRGLHLLGRSTKDRPACRHGHPYPENQGVDRNGWYFCRECKRARQRVWWVSTYGTAQPDDVAVERAVAGDPPVRLTPREREAAIRRLDAQLLPAAVIAERVRCSKRTVHRARSRQRAAS